MFEPDQAQHFVGPDLDPNFNCKGYQKTTKLAKLCGKDLRNYELTKFLSFIFEKSGISLEHLH